MVEDGDITAGTISGAIFVQGGVIQGVFSGLTWGGVDFLQALLAIEDTGNHAPLADLLNGDGTIDIDASNAGAGLDMFDLLGSLAPLITQPVNVLGGDGNDYLFGGSGNDTIDAGSNNYSEDIIFGTYGNDTINFARVTTTSYVQLNYSDLIDGAITVTLNGDTNTGSVSGTGFTDTLLNVRNVMESEGFGFEGTEGNDTYNMTVHSAGWVAIIGSEGADTFNLDVDGTVRLSFGANYNSPPTQAVNVNLATGVVADDGYGNVDQINWLGGSGRIAVRGTVFNDVMIGSARNDTFITELGNDTVDGGAGFDRLRYDRNGITTVTVDLNAGTATGIWHGSAFTDTLTSIEQVRGSREGADTLRGSDADEHFSGRGGNDSINGRDGDDTIYGDAGNDSAYGADGEDDIYGGDGNDNLYGNSGNDTLRGEDHDDRLSGGSGNDSLLGDAGDDTIYGGSGNDTIRGGSGENDIDAGSGNDKVYGGSGDETIDGGSGDDQLVGGGGDDRADGGLGDDTLYGNDGNDTLNGEDGNDWSSGGDGADLLLGRDGNDTMRGGNEGDRFYGGADDDLLAGNFGNDTLEGGSGDDRIFGGNDDDVLVGGSGTDVLGGGSGADVFVFEDVDDSAHGAGRDRITDFTHNLDQIDLSDIMSGLTFVSSYSGTAGEVRYNSSIGRLYIDIDGDNASDFSVDISGAPTLDAGDLIL